MAIIETVKISKGGAVVKVNKCDLEAWEADGWKRESAKPEPKAEQADKPKRKRKTE